MRMIKTTLLLVITGAALAENSEGCVAATSDTQCSMCFGILDANNKCLVFDPKGTESCILSAVNPTGNVKMCVFCRGENVPVSPGTIGCTAIVNSYDKVANCDSYSAVRQCGFCKSEHALNTDKSSCVPVPEANKIHNCWEYNIDVAGRISCNTCSAGYQPGYGGLVCVTGTDNCQSGPSTGAGGSCGTCKIKAGYFAATVDPKDSKLSICKKNTVLNVPTLLGITISAFKKISSGKSLIIAFEGIVLLIISVSLVSN